jgi:hypothetical protein
MYYISNSARVTLQTATHLDTHAVMYDEKVEFFFISIRISFNLPKT